MANASLMDRIKSGKLRPNGPATAQAAAAAMRDMKALEGLAGLDTKARYRARKELMQIVVDYRRALKVKKMKRRKHTRG